MSKQHDRRLTRSRDRWWNRTGSVSQNQSRCHLCNQSI